MKIWKLSSAGRASALQAEGHRFEPCSFHQNGRVVQLVRTLACHARGRGFEPHLGRHFASVAQLVEQGTENPRVVGSIPIGGTTLRSYMTEAQFADLAHLVERDLAKVEVAGSNPVIRSIFYKFINLLRFRKEDLFGRRSVQLSEYRRQDGIIAKR